MDDFLRIVARWAMALFLLSSMAEFGLGLKLRQIVAPLKNARLVALSLAANFLVAPLLSVGIARLLRLEEPLAIGLLLLGLAPGAPFLPKVVEVARHGVAFAVGLVVLLTAGTVILLPVALPLVVEGTEVDAAKIARSLLLLLFLPFCAGMFAAHRFPSLSARLRPPLRALSGWSGLAVLALIVVLSFKSLLSLLGSGAVLAAAVFVVLSSLAGWLAGGPDCRNREVLGLATGLRNVAAALLVGAENFPDPRVNAMVIVGGLIGILILLPAARVWGRRSKLNGAEGPAPPEAVGSKTSVTTFRIEDTVLSFP